MSHNAVPARFGRNIRHVKMFTGDVLCCLKYGDVWGIDETVMDIRGSIQELDAGIVDGFERQHGHLKKSDPKAYEKEWEKVREKSERSAHVGAKK